MKNLMRRISLSVLTIILSLTTIFVSSPAFAAYVTKGDFISGGGISTHYGNGWDWSLSNGMESIYVDGALGYCLEPALTVQTNNASSVPLSSVTGVKTHPNRSDAPIITLNATLRNKIALIANYGHGYPGHSGNKWIWATQKLIWQELGHRVSGGMDVSPEMNTILSLVNGHETPVSWNGETRKVKNGDVIILSGANLWQYNSSASKGVSVSTSGNNFNVTITNANDARFIIDKKQGVQNGTSMVFSDGSSQKVMVAKLQDPKSGRLNFEPATGNVELGKQDTDGNWISGTVFELSKDKSKILGTYTTASNGRVTAKDFDEGTYYVREKSVPAPLLIDSTWKSISIKAGETLKFTATNAKATGLIEVTKENVYGDLVEGVKFDIKNASGSVVDTLVTDGSGKATSKTLPLGKYTVVETGVISGLVLDPKPISVELKYKDQVTPVIVEGIKQINEFQKGEITITKIENDWDSLQTEYNGINLSDALIKLYAKTDIYEGSKRIYIAGELVGEERTDAAGQVKFHNIPLGEYYAVEAQAPKGYVILDGTWDISVKYDGNNATSKVTPVGKTVSNQVIYGKANLVKQDGNNKLLEGAVFGVFTKDGKQLQEITSDHKGRVITADLRYGDYYFQEIEAPVGYWYSDEKHHFTIDEHEETIYLTTNNNPIAAKLFVHKYDSENEVPLEGASFKIRDLSNNEWVSIKFQEGKDVITKDTWTTDEDGEFLLEVNIPYGKYQLVEIEAPEGYNLSDPIDFVIDENQNYIELEVIGAVLETGVPNRPIRSDVAITKIDVNTGEKLPGFEFKLTNLATGEETIAVTNEDGLAVFEQFKYGRYMVEEIKVGGEYIIDTKPQYVDIVEDSIVYELTFKNFKPLGELKLEKVDYKDYTGVKGAIYGLYNLDDELIKEATTNKDGVAVFRGISLGEYYVQEISSPDGYLLDETKYSVAVEYVDDSTPVIHLDMRVVEMREVEIGTSASFVERDKEEPNIITLVDEVHYENLIIGKEYTVYGKLMNKDTGEVVLIDGKEVTGTTTFVAEKHDGTVEVYFTFDQNKLETKTVVVFEDMYEEGILVAVHHDITDVEQTVEIPEAKTKASFVERDKEEPNIITLVDEVHYEGLVVGNEYTVNGKLMDKNTGEPILIDGKEVSGTTTFIAEKSNGVVNVYFTFDQNKLKTDSVVVFEDIYEGERLIAVHHDLEDTDQTVNFIQIHINKKDSVSGKVLKDAEFTMYDKDGNVIDVKRTDKNGLATFMIVEGEFVTLKETDAPKGYKLSKEVIEVDATKGIDGNVYSVEYFNELLPIIELPKTGEGLSPVLIAAYGFIVLGSILAIRKKRYSN